MPSALARKIGSGFCFVSEHQTPCVPDTSWLLDAMKNPLTQEYKTGFAVHHTLDQFNSGDLPFDLTIVDGARKSWTSRYVVSRDGTAKRNATRCSRSIFSNVSGQRINCETAAV